MNAHRDTGGAEEVPYCTQAPASRLRAVVVTIGVALVVLAGVMGCVV